MADFIKGNYYLRCLFRMLMIHSIEVTNKNPRIAYCKYTGDSFARSYHDGKWYKVQNYDNK